VGLLEGFGDLCGDPGGLLRREWTFPGQSILQGPSTDQLHHDVGAILGATEVIDGGDVGPGEAGGRLGFAFEPANRALARRQRLGEHLDRYGTAQGLVLGLPHGPHASRADHPDKPVSIAE
jgi:hypothetical protein